MPEDTFNLAVKSLATQQRRWRVGYKNPQLTRKPTVSGSSGLLKPDQTREGASVKHRAWLRPVPEGTGCRPEERQMRAVLTAPSAQRRRPGELLTCAGRPGAPPPSTATSGAREEMREKRMWRRLPQPGPALRNQAPPSIAKVTPSMGRLRPPRPGLTLHDQAPPSTSRSLLSLPSPALPRLGLALYSQDTPILPSSVLCQAQKLHN